MYCCAFMKHKPLYSTVIALSSIYFILGFLWIKFSDVLLFRLISDPIYLTTLQTYKGWFFILCSGLFFYLALTALYNQFYTSNLVYEELFSINRDGLVVMDLNYIVQDANDSFVAQIGGIKHHVIGKKVTDILMFDWDEAERARLVEQIKQRGYTDIYVKNVRLLNGESRPFEIFSYRIRNKKTTLVCSVIRDVAASQQIHDELVLAKNKAEESDQLKTAFLQNMSHEIRTPLNGIVGFSELLRSTGLPTDKRNDYIDTITRSSAQLLSIVNDVLDISKIETGQQVVCETEFNVNHLIDEIYDEFSQHTTPLGLTLSITKPLADGSASILADRSKIYQIFSHLINNAIKFTAEGSIKIGYRLDKAEIIFFVIDTGLGIPRELHNVIFERFRKSENYLRKDYGGTGLGLAICKGYTELMKGRIWVESASKGSQFYFAIENKRVIVQEAVKRPHYDGVKVLVAEDEDINFRYINEVFRSHNITVERAMNGVEAVEMMRANGAYDIVFMDVRMPRMDGLQATRKIREFDQKTPIIAQTAFVMSDSKLNAFESGCNDYVSKPIKQSELFGMIDKYVNRR